MADEEGEALPSGTLTFVFTDIEGSSEAWTRRPDATAAALTLHNRLVLDATERNRGVEIKNLGDGFCLVFAVASDAIAMAIDTQVALQAADWPEGQRLKTRIGMHTGEAIPTNGDYFGETINRAARVMDAANGDQIMVSAATAGVLDTATRGAQWNLTTIGDFDLKGIGATTLHRLSSPNLLADERPARAKPVGVQRLPQNLQSFIGREHELSELAEHVRDHRLVTLVGVGGTGKSRLAIELARQVAANHADGVYWCPLAQISDPDDVVVAISNVVGVTPRPGRTLAESLALTLADQKALLVVDNCEHVSDAAAAVIHEILHDTIGPRVLATSRRALQLTSEVVWPVEPLVETDDQVELFLDRVRERDASFDPGPDDRAIITRICAALDGLPLAIELAAARARIMQPSEILERLDDRFALLGARRSTNERLRDIVRWSYEQLGPDEATLFRSLSVFAGGFSLDAALAVCGSADLDELELLDALQTLVDDALISRGGRHANRFFMLETLRQFGAEELETTDEIDGIHEAFITWVTHQTGASAGLVNTPREFEGFDELDRERANLREAFTLLTDGGRHDEAADLIGPLFYYATLTVQFEVCGWATELCERDDLQSHPRFGDLCATASYGAYGQADTATSLEFARRGLDVVPDSGPGQILGTMSAIAQGDLGMLLELFETVLPGLDDQPPEVRFWIRAWQALLDEWVAGKGEAPMWAEAAELAASECGGTTAMAGASWVHGVVQAARDPEASAAHFRRALDMLGERAQRNLVAQTARDGLMALLSQHGTVAEAVDACRANFDAVLANDWIAVVFEILPPVTTLIRADEPVLAAQLVGCAEEHGIYIRGRTHKALAQLDDALVANAKAQGAELSLRQVLVRIVAGLAAWQDRHASAEH